MKKQLFIIAFIFFGLKSFSQNNFQKAYFINNSGQKTECLIKNIDWKNNPTGFEYKQTENENSKTATINSVLEFGIYNASKYIRATVNIDRSKDNIDDLSIQREPEFRQEQLFLNVLIEGKATLYQYEDSGLSRFFYKIEDQEIQQLVYKSYRMNQSNLINQNEYFKQQLFINLKCESITDNSINSIEYEKSDLIEIFEKYNICNNPNFVNFKTKEKKDLFNLNIRPGLSSSSLSAGYVNLNLDFSNELTFRLGIESEFILGFNNNKWAVIIEPIYQYYKSETYANNRNVMVDYKSLQLSMGIRHYFFLNNKSKIFINGLYILDYPSDSKITNITVAGYKLDIDKTGSGLLFGFGYNYNDNYNLEFRYTLPREILGQYSVWTSDYNTISIIFGYTIF